MAKTFLGSLLLSLASVASKMSRLTLQSSVLFKAAVWWMMVSFTESHRGWGGVTEIYCTVLFQVYQLIQKSQKNWRSSSHPL